MLHIMKGKKYISLLIVRKNKIKYSISEHSGMVFMRINNDLLGVYFVPICV